jgi:hypothetical protein
MRLVCLLLVVAAGCGGNASGGGDAGNCGADGVCTPGCTDDPDCTAVCGDNACTDNELCSNCAPDCATRDLACGNGACEGGEDTTTCFADCGPSPWTWATDEQQLLDMVNAIRTAGLQCPGAPTVTIAPPLALQASFVPSAHEWAWEVAHQNFVSATGGACNGRTFDDRAAAGGYVSFVLSRDHATVEAAVTAWKTSAVLCPIMMNPQRTEAATAIAMDAAKSYLIVMN